MQGTWPWHFASASAIQEAASVVVVVTVVEACVVVEVLLRQVNDKVVNIMTALPFSAILNTSPFLKGISSVVLENSSAAAAPCSTSFKYTPTVPSVHWLPNCTVT
jgi:ABC-type glucose/galactose transport system permease subunit